MCIPGAAASRAAGGTILLLAHGGHSVFASESKSVDPCAKSPPSHQQQFDWVFHWDSRSIPLPDTNPSPLILNEKKKNPKKSDAPIQCRATINASQVAEQFHS